MERAIQVQFLAFSTKHDLLSDYQSGSRKKHSTETALVYLTDYILKHMDRQITKIVPTSSMSSSQNIDCEAWETSQRKEDSPVMAVRCVVL